MGTDTNLVRATKTAVREAIAFLQTERSTACDVEITQLVDGTLGAHVMIPKNIFVGRGRTPN